jgi:acyl dehydratase
VTHHSDLSGQAAENGPELLFADLPKGRVFRPLAYPVTQELVAQFMEVTGDRHPLYQPGAGIEGPFGRPVGPPGLAAIYSRLSYLQDHAMPSGGVLAKQEFEFLSPIEIGETLQVKAEVADRYVDEKGRKRVDFFIEARHTSGEVVSITRLYAIWPK